MIREKVLLTGAKGQLGYTFSVLFERSELSKRYELQTIDVEEVDFTNSNSIHSALSGYAASIIVNCGAYTAVDQAERQHELAEKINSEAVAIMTEWAQKERARLIQISTDFVFDGNNTLPYIETDKPNPINNYGRSKFLGENSIFKYELKNSIILRTSWLYSYSNNNFVTKIVNKIKEGKDFNIYSDEIGSPTSAFDLANAILFCIPKIKNNQTEIFHFSNLGYCSRLDFARKISDLLECDLIISRSDSETNVKRPKFSPLSTKKFIDIFDYNVNEWGVSLKNHISQNYG